MNTDACSTGSCVATVAFAIYMNDIPSMSRSLDFIPYTEDTTLINPFSSFVRSANNDTNCESDTINSVLGKRLWLAFNQSYLNDAKAEFSIFCNYQK